jgi:tRNA dimethylallyltransferase
MKGVDVPVIAIVGPTCTGKTSLSLQLAQKIGGEIVACDSRTIYRYMDIGTAKPTSAERSLINHHLLDVLEPKRFFTVAEYKKLGQEVIEDIFARGKTPIVCGGTGLYARALLEGISIPPVPPQPELRRSFNLLADEKGNAQLYEKLKAVDPASAERLSVNDRVRIIRALEVTLVAGKPFSTLARRSEPPFQTVWFGLSVGERSVHASLIEKRLLDQFSNGLVQEALELLAQPEFEAVLRNAVNYKEFIPYMEGKEDLATVQAECILHNMQLARKQMTWFKANSQITWFQVDEIAQGKILATMIEAWKRASVGNHKR